VPEQGHLSRRPRGTSAPNRRYLRQGGGSYISGRSYARFRRSAGFRRAFALVSADVFDRVLGTWVRIRAAQADGRLVITDDGKTVRGAKSRNGKAPHLLEGFASLVGAVLTIGAMRTSTTYVSHTRTSGKLRHVQQKTHFASRRTPRNLAIGVLRLDGHASIAANRHHARDPQRTLKLLQAA
jgi:hypothetical protein